MTEDEAMKVFSFIALLEARKYEGKEIPEASLDYLAKANDFLKKQCDTAPSRYPWKDAPDWAKFAATDADGDASWYDIEPICEEEAGMWCVATEGRWWVPEEARFWEGKIPCPNWQKTLEERPE